MATTDSITTAPGLTSAEAAERLARFGPDQLKARRQSALLQFLSRFRNPLVLILLAASGTSALTGEAKFRTGWFVESLATQVLVIFIIRTRGNVTLRLAGTSSTGCW